MDQLVTTPEHPLRVLNGYLVLSIPRVGKEGLLEPKLTETKTKIKLLCIYAFYTGRLCKNDLPFYSWVDAFEEGPAGESSTHQVYGEPRHG